MTGDPEAVLWLEEIRQEVVRANQDTDAAQRSKRAGVGVGGQYWREEGLGEARRCGLSGSPDSQVASPVTSFSISTDWEGRPEREQEGCCFDHRMDFLAVSWAGNPLESRAPGPPTASFYAFLCACSSSSVSM